MSGILLGSIGIGVIAVLFIAWFGKEILGGFLGLYRIVPPNEAHIRVLHNDQTVFSKNTGKTAYWFIPFVTKIQRIPLTNLTIPVENIKLNDSNMAKFVCELVCFVHIENIELAVQRLPVTKVETELGFNFIGLSKDLQMIMEGIGRTVAAQQTILEIYQNRGKLNEAIIKDISEVFPKWGLNLVNLELIELKDAEGSTIIADIERKSQAEIKKDAEIKIATTTRETEVAKAEAEEIYKKRQIEKDQAIQLADIAKLKTIGIEKAKANQEISTQNMAANIQQVEAQRKLDVGSAEIAKQVKEQNAMGDRIQIEQAAEADKSKVIKFAEANKQKIILDATADKEKVVLAASAFKEKLELEGTGTRLKNEAEAEGNKALLVKDAEGRAAQQREVGLATAEVIQAQGQSEANAIRLKKLADAEGTLKTAEALKQYTEAGLSIEVIKAGKEIQIAKYKSLAESLSKADMKFIMPGDKAPNFFGMSLDAFSGTNIKLFAEELGLDPNAVGKVMAALPGKKEDK